MRSEMQHAVVELREWPTLHTEQVMDQEVRIMDQKCKSLIKKDVVWLLAQKTSFAHGWAW